MKRGSQAFSTASGRDAADQLDELLAVGGVDALGAEAVRLAEALGGGLRALERDVGQHDVLEDRAPLGDRRERRAHSARSDHENPHRSAV